MAGGTYADFEKLQVKGNDAFPTCDQSSFASEEILLWTSEHGIVAGITHIDLSAQRACSMVNKLLPEITT
jgi:hypothetical protein